MEKKEMVLHVLHITKFINELYPTSVGDLKNWEQIKSLAKERDLLLKQLVKVDFDKYRN